MPEPTPSTSESTPDQSFEECILDKFKGPTDKPKVKQRKIDLMAKVVTHSEFVEAIRAKEQEKDKPKKKKNKEMNEDDDDVLPVPQDEGSEVDINENSDDASDDDESGFKVPTTPRQAMTYLCNTWASISPPNPESGIQDHWFAAIYYHKKKQQIFIGKCR